MERTTVGKGGSTFHIVLHPVVAAATTCARRPAFRLLNKAAAFEEWRRPSLPMCSRRGRQEAERKKRWRQALTGALNGVRTPICLLCRGEKNSSMAVGGEQ